MTDDTRDGPGAVLLRGYTMDAGFLDGWVARHELGQGTLAAALDPAARTAELLASSASVLTAAIAQARTRCSKLLTLADLDLACRKLALPWPYGKLL